jgi:LacI family transcriptional regulator, galactose operon repressor
LAKSSTIKRITISDVSKHAGVSIATVSRVLNNNFPVSEETAAKVRAAIKELNFIPNSSARILAGGKTHVLGLIIPEIAALSLIPLLAGIEMTTRSMGYGLLIYSSGVDSVPGEKIRHILNENNTDGMLVYVNSLDESELTRLNQIGFPLVLLHHTPPKNLSIPYITFHNKRAAQELVDHLIEVHSYRRIAWLRGPEGHEDSASREMGYLKSLSNHNIPFDPGLVGYGGFGYRDARETVSRWLEQKLEVDAIFAGADEAAFGAISAIQEAGQRVPEDIAVVGFDDIDLGRHLFPPLTTIRADFEQAGRQAVLQLVNLITTGKASNKVTVPTRLVIRRSCNCPWESGASVPGS